MYGICLSFISFLIFVWNLLNCCAWNVDSFCRLNPKGKMDIMLSKMFVLPSAFLNIVCIWLIISKNFVIVISLLFSVYKWYNSNGYENSNTVIFAEYFFILSFKKSSIIVCATSFCISSISTIRCETNMSVVLIRLSAVDLGPIYRLVIWFLP